MMDDIDRGSVLALALVIAFDSLIWLGIGVLIGYWVWG